MKITTLESVALAIPFSHGAERAGFEGQDWSKIHMVLLRIETAEGVIGWGDAFGYGCWKAVKCAIDQMIAPLVIGREIDDIGRFMKHLAHVLHIFGRNGVMQYALSGLDIGLWDIKGKLAGLPLHKLLGSAGRTAIPGYSSLFKYGDSDVVARMCQESLDEGFRWIKLHETGSREIETARKTTGPDVGIMVDVNCAWTLEQALAEARTLRELDVHWLEEPIFPPEDFKTIAKCQSLSGLPLGAGENACGVSEFEKMMDVGAVSFAQPSVTKVGGVTTFLEVDALCRQRGVPVFPHSPYFGPGFLATLQLLAARPEESLVEQFKLKLEADLFYGRTSPKAGYFRVPDAPGLGCDPDPAVISAFRVDL
jgi:L-alanine-DL-glutamate epimerase-like enolase superfamily enzyme